jgi:hypothetical protein
MRDAMGKRVRLARARPGDHEERGARRAGFSHDTVLDGAPLFGIELVEIGDGHGQRIARKGLPERSMFLFCSQRSSKTASHEFAVPVAVAG